MHRTMVSLIVVGMIGGFLSPGISFSGQVEDEVFVLIRAKELLAFSEPAQQWFKRRFRPKESVLRSAYGGRVGVVFTNKRILGFSSVTNKWQEELLMVDEELETLEANGNVGAVITNRRALGFSGRAGKWISERFGIK